METNGTLPNLWWVVVPCALVVAACTWGLLSPLSQWRAMWARQHRFAHLSEHAGVELVRRSSVFPLVLAAAIGLIALVVLISRS